MNQMNCIVRIVNDSNCTNFLAYFAKCLNLLNYHGGGSMIINTFYSQVKGFDKITMYGIMYHIVLSS